jgi:hypothetical protein
VCVCVASLLHRAGNLALPAGDSVYPLRASISPNVSGLLSLSLSLSLSLLLLPFFLDLYWSFFVFLSMRNDHICTFTPSHNPLLQLRVNTIDPHPHPSPLFWTPGLLFCRFWEQSTGTEITANNTIKIFLFLGANISNWTVNASKLRGTKQGARRCPVFRLNGQCLKDGVWGNGDTDPLSPNLRNYGSDRTHGGPVCCTSRDSSVFTQQEAGGGPKADLDKGTKWKTSPFARNSLVVQPVAQALYWLSYHIHRTRKYRMVQKQINRLVQRTVKML